MGKAICTDLFHNTQTSPPNPLSINGEGEK